MHPSTIPQFCERWGFSRAFYYKLKRKGLTPREAKIGKCRRITSEAEAEWAREREAA